MRRLKLAIVLVLSLVLVLYVVQNTSSVQAHFLGFTAEMSLVVLLFLTGAIGVTGVTSELVLSFILKGKRAQPVEKRERSNKRSVRVTLSNLEGVILPSAKGTGVLCDE